MQAPPEEPHFHSRIKCKDIEVRNELIYVYGKSVIIRRAFCLKHQVAICWAADECGWKIGHHFGDDSSKYFDIARSQNIKKGMAKHKAN